jgi:dTDP-D-glucose 4,6-dehydratase/intein/homing endonuclease
VSAAWLPRRRCETRSIHFYQQWAVHLHGEVLEMWSGIRRHIAEEMKGSMKVLITGAAGFLGAHLVEHLLKETNWELILLDKLAYASNGMSRLRDIKVFDQQKNRVSMYCIDVSYPLSTGVMKEVGAVDYIIHLAAETDVNRSIADPRPFIQSNVVGTMEMLQFARTVGSRLKCFYQQSCYDEKTRALTKDGFKRFDELKIGDKVLSLNVGTGVLEEKDVSRVIVQDYNGELIHFTGKVIDIAVTPNHRMYYELGGEIKISSAEELADYGYSYPSGDTQTRVVRGDWTGKRMKSVHVAGLGDYDAADLFYICGVFIGDGTVDHDVKKRKNKSGLSKLQRDVVAHDPKTGRFISGVTGKAKHSIENPCRIFFHVPKGDKARKPLLRALDNLGIEYREYKRTVYFGSGKWVKFFKQFGRFARNKHIPLWMIGAERRLLYKLWVGLIDSDGWWDTGGAASFHTCSRSLVRDICELGLKLGKFVNFQTRIKAGKGIICGHQAKWGDNYTVFFSRTARKIGKFNATRKPYSGKIWCVTVPDNKNLVVERNGKLFISGNTDEVFGPCYEGAPPFKEWSRPLPTNPYSGAKAAADMLCLAWANTYDIPLVVSHCMNLFGERQHPEKYIPLVVRKILRSETIYVHSDPTRTKAGSRAYIHCRNASAAIQFILENAKPGMGMKLKEKYNIVGEQEIDNLGLAKAICGIMERALDRRLDLKTELVDFHSSRPGHDLRYSLDGRKLAQLGWSPPKTFMSSLEKTVQWMVEPSNLHWLMVGD